MAIHVSPPAAASVLAVVEHRECRKMASVGFWGNPSSTLDWCEANYEVSYYIAEFWNTISNVFMIGLAGIGAIFSYLKGYESKNTLSFVSLMCVGLGSWLFHMTLLYHFQLADELPMIWGSAVLIFALHEVNCPPGERSWLIQTVLFSYCLAVTVIYLSTRNALFFQTCYGVMVMTMVAYCIYIIKNFEHSKLLVASSLAVYGSGFLMWLIDYHYCHVLRSTRAAVSDPVQPVLQFHAWWHVCAGIGTYLGILFSIHARLAYLKRQPQLKVIGGLLPVVTRTVAQ